jgi:Zinc finger, C3HC4 type (RING finger)
MGNSLWRAIEREQWIEVKVMLSDERSHQLVRTQMYTVRRQIFPKLETEERVWILHFLLWKAAPIYIVQLVLDIDPSQLVKESLPCKELPAHFAAMNPIPGFNVEALELILDKNPEALKRKSLRGQTPLHIACESLQPIWFIRKLVSKEPSTVDIRDAHDQTPWDILQIKSGSLLYYNNRLKGVLGHVGKATTVQVDRVSGTSSSPTRKKQKLPQFKPKATQICDKTVLEVTGPVACTVCTEKAAGWAIVPCGHLCLCRDCSSEHSPHSRVAGCPICDEPIELCIQIIAAGISLSISENSNQIQ